MHNWRETVISQYAHSSNMLELIARFDAAIDPKEAVEALRRDVLDPDTAEGWGLDVWGRIVGIGRTFESINDVAAWGFAGSGANLFGHGVFYAPHIGKTHMLADNAYRLLIYMKAAANITDGTLPDINRIMATLFAERGHVAVVHVDTMKIRYVVGWCMAAHEMALLLRDDIPPRPAGVGYDVYQAIPAHTFGFAGSGAQNFNHGIYQPGGPIDAYSFYS